MRIFRQVSVRLFLLLAALLIGALAIYVQLNYSVHREHLEALKDQVERARGELAPETLRTMEEWERLKEAYAGDVSYIDNSPDSAISGNSTVDLDGPAINFGLPLVEVGGQAYLSRSASVAQAGNTLRKRYEMDTIDTPSGFLRRKYEPVPSIGTVVVSYTVTTGTIEVAVDLTGLQAACVQQVVDEFGQSIALLLNDLHTFADGFDVPLCVRAAQGAGIAFDQGHGRLELV